MFTSLSTSTGALVALREPVRDREAVPAGHDRRARPAARVANSTGPGDADADAAHLAAARARLRASSSLEALVRRTPRTALGAVGDVHVEGASRRAASPARSVTARRECVAPRSATRTTPGALVEGQHGGGAPAGGRAARRPRRSARCASSASTRWATVERAEPGPAGEVRARDRLAVADQTEQRTRAGRQACSNRHTVRHRARSKAELAAGLESQNGQKFGGAIRQTGRCFTRDREITMRFSATVGAVRADPLMSLDRAVDDPGARRARWP